MPPAAQPRQTHYSPLDLLQLWVRNGGPFDVAAIMGAVGYAESKGDPQAHHHNNNGTDDDGLWQVNSVHGYDPQRLRDDPDYTAKAAVAVYKKQGLRAWKTYNTGAYRKVKLGTGAYNIPLSDFHQDAVTRATDSVTNTVGGITGFINRLGIIFDGGFWLRVGKVVLGAIALILGAVLMGRAFSKTDTVQSVTGPIKSAAGTALAAAK